MRRLWPSKLPEQLLIPAGLSALTVTALSDVNEIVPFGHELGIGVSGLAFAYLTGYIFNWLVVERPRKQLEGAAVGALWRQLRDIQDAPVLFVSDIVERQRGTRVPRPMKTRLTEQQFADALESRYTTQTYIPDPVYINVAVAEERHDDAWALIDPLLGRVNPELVILLTRTNLAAQHLFEAGKNIREPDNLYHKFDREQVVRAAMAWRECSRDLATYFKQVGGTPAGLLSYWQQY